MDNMQQTKDSLAWKVEISIWNKYLVWDMIKLSLAVPLLLLFVLVMAWLEDSAIDWRAMGLLVLTSLATLALIFFFSFILMRMVHGTTYSLHYLVDNDGIHLLRTPNQAKDETMAKTAEAIASSEHPWTRGLAEKHRASRSLFWSDIRKIKPIPRELLVRVGSSFFVTLSLFCPDRITYDRLLQFLSGRRNIPRVG